MCDSTQNAMLGGGITELWECVNLSPLVNCRPKARATCCDFFPWVSADDSTEEADHIKTCEAVSMRSAAIFFAHVFAENRQFVHIKLQRHVYMLGVYNIQDQVKLSTFSTHHNISSNYWAFGNYCRTFYTNMKKQISLKKRGLFKNKTKDFFFGPDY